MDRYKICMRIATLTMIAALSACAKERTGGLATIEPARPEPAVPDGYRKIAPSVVDSSQQMLAQTASIFRGALKEVRFTYDDCAGPRTNYEFSDSTTLVGAQVQPHTTVRVFGGPTPQGLWVEASELPQLALDSEYVVFLRNTDWTFSPIVRDLVFRVESIAGREALVAPSGYSVTGWGDRGPQLSSTPVSEAVGTHLHRLRPTDRPTAPSTTAATSATPDVKPATGSISTAAPGRTADSVLADAPSLADIRAAGFFTRPITSAAAVANTAPFSTESLVTAVKAAAARSRAEIGGRLTLEPYWRCVNSTTTVTSR